MSKLVEYRDIYLIYINGCLHEQAFYLEAEAMAQASKSLKEGKIVSIKPIRCKGKWVEE